MVIEFTDDKIFIYNKKTKKVIEENILPMIVVNNKIYDYLKLKKILSRIVYKYRLVNGFFKTCFDVVLFEKITPSEEYLYNNLFDGSIKVNLVMASSLLDENVHIMISGNLLYYKEEVLRKIISNKDYILVGNADKYKYDTLEKWLQKKYDVNILKYENSQSLIYSLV